MSPTPTGGSLLDTAVERFYDLVLADPRLAPWFAGVDLARLRRAHAGLGIDDAALDRVADHLLAALAAVGVEDGHLDDVRTVVEGLRHQVVEV